MTFAKRIFNLLWMALLVVILAGLTLAETAQAAEVNDATVKQTLQALEIIDSSAGNNTVSRADFAHMLMQSSPARGTVAAVSSISPYADVSFKHPAAGYIRAVSTAGYMSAYADGNFHPDEAVDGGTAVKALLTLLGYSREQYGVDYWQFASALHLLDDLSIASGTKLSQNQANRLIYNTLKAANASGKTHLEALGFTITNGVIDLQSVINETASGPITIKSANWHAGSGLKIDSLIVYRNDTLSTLAALQNYDVVYYNTGMNTAWAYSDKVSGVYKSASPSRLAPSSINVSGLEYMLSEAASAKLAAANTEYGETLILLLGAGGVVADILPQSEIIFDVTGFATAAEKTTFTDADGTTYNGYTLTLITVDGSVLTYEVRRNYSSMVGKLVKFSMNNGEIGVIARPASSLSGAFNAANMTLGEVKVAADVLILETYTNGAYDVTYPARLDGVYIAQGKVLHYAKNSDGAISTLFLSGVTGDSLGYGILTEVNETRPGSSSSTGSSDGEESESSESSSSGTAISGSYSYVVNGKNGTANLGTALHVEKGVYAFIFKNGQLDTLRPMEELTKVTLNSAGFVLDRSGNRYMLSTNVSIYQHTGSEYKLLSLKQALELDTTFTAYYDKPEADGGRVRVLIADEKNNKDK